MTFAEREGHRPRKVDLQVDAMDEELRVGIINVLALLPPEARRRVLVDYYLDVRVSVDAVPALFAMAWDTLKDLIRKGPWFEVYTIVEHAVRTSPWIRKELNAALERDASGYRIAGKNVVRITSELEMGALEQAASGSAPWAEHISSASTLLFDRKQPDYRNAIKESISAVEAAARSVSGDEKATLGDALKKIPSLHPALMKGFSSLYGYTSDAGGLRHALTEDAKPPTFEEALFMLIACSAFVNFLVGSTS